MFKKLVSLLVIAMMIMSLATGCSQPAETPAEKPAETPAETPAEKPAETPAETPAEPTDEDQEYLIWNIGTESRTFDPTLNNASDGGHLINNLFEGLMRETADGIEPAQAESYEISANAEGVEGTVYTFKLRDDIKWSDGKPVTAADFEYAWKRACDPEAASEYAFIVTSYVKGGEEFFNGEGTRDEVAVKALDEKTLQVELKFPVPYFLSLTGFYTYMPVRQDIVEQYGEGWEKNPETCIGNGPFKLAEFQTGSHVLLVKNDNYYKADEVKLKGVKGLMITEATTAQSAYEAGEIQVNDTIPPDEVPRLIAEDPNFVSMPRIGTYYGIFNVDKAPTDDVRVRKALTLAIDRKAICELIMKGGQIPATGFVPPSLSFSDGTCFRQLDDKGFPQPEYGIDASKALVEEAQALLAEAGYPNGEGFPTITYKYNTGDAHQKVAEALQEMWKTNLNINVELSNMEWGVFQDERRVGNFEICRGGWLGDYKDPMTMLDLWTSYSGNNDAQWRWEETPAATHDKTLNESNKGFDEAIAKAMITTGKERDEQLKKAEQILMDEMVTLPIYYYSYLYEIDQSKVEGVTRTAMGHWVFKDAELVD